MYEAKLRKDAMKQTIVYGTILCSLLFTGCEQFFDYWVLDTHGNSHEELTMEITSNIELSAVGQYTFIGETNVYSIVSVRIKNASEVPVTLDMEDIRIHSEHFEYAWENSRYNLTIDSHDSDAFLMELATDRTKILPSTPDNYRPQIPEGEILTVYLPQLKMNGAVVSLPSIRFIPKPYKS